MEKDDKQVTMKISSADVPIKEIEGPIVISDLDQSDLGEISVGVVANDHESPNSKSASENFQHTWCPLGLSKVQIPACSL